MRDALSAAVRRLDDSGVEGAGRDARLLLAWAAEVSRTEFAIALSENAPLSPAAMARFTTAIERRAGRVPVSQILGGRWFYGRWFAVTADVLDPRPESETLVAAAIDHLRSVDAAAPRVLDLGVGSGCLLASVLLEIPGATGLGVDASPSALEVARTNMESLGLSARVVLREGDWLSQVAERFDAILCNPPYIDAAAWERLAPETRVHEPKGALTPGLDGLSVYRALAPKLPARLTEGGAVFFEVGLGQADAVAGFLAAEGFGVGVESDLDGRARVVRGVLSLARGEACAGGITD